MKMSSLPLLRMSPPGAVISENFCMRFGWEAGGCCAGVRGCADGAGTTAGPPRRAGDGAGAADPAPPPGAAGPPPEAPAPTAPRGVPGPPAPGVCCAEGAVPGDCTVGVLALPAFVRPIVLGGCAIPAPLTLACCFPMLVTGRGGHVVPWGRRGPPGSRTRSSP